MPPQTLLPHVHLPPIRLPMQLRIPLRRLDRRHPVRVDYKRHRGGREPRGRFARVEGAAGVAGDFAGREGRTGFAVHARRA